jgi:puromycin-sensitive aminopeptidase
VVAPRLALLGWDAAPGESDDVKLARAAVVRALAVVARSGGAVAEAKRRETRVLAGERGALDPNLLDAVALAAARNGDAALFAELAARVTSEPDPATRRRHLVALTAFEAEPLHDRAIDLFATDAVPMQDSSTYLGALLANRALRDRAWDWIGAHWREVTKKAAAPMLLRRVVEAFGELHHRRADVERFLDATPELATQPQAVRQTRERLRLDEDVARRAAPELAAWLARRA